MGFIDWDNDGHPHQTIIKDIWEIKKQTGSFPTEVVLNSKTFYRLIRHPDMIERLSYFPAQCRIILSLFMSPYDAPLKVTMDDRIGAIHDFWFNAPTAAERQKAEYRRLVEING